MITAVNIGFRVPGSGEPTTATLEISARTTDEAFEQATRKLQLQLIEGVLDIRPWANQYQYDNGVVS